MKTKNKLIIDIDGVVCDFNKVVLDELSDLLQREVNYHELIEYGLSNFDIDIDSLVDNIEKKNGYINAPLIEGTKEALDELNEKYCLIYLTNRNESSMIQTVNWFHKHKLPFDFISFTQEKGKVAFANGLSLAIDDNPEVLYEYNHRLINTLKFVHPYNLNYWHPMNKDVYSWNEILEVLK